jgi:hypothetical protein
MKTIWTQTLMKATVVVVVFGGIRNLQMTADGEIHQHVSVSP